jgi:hypothetical protein
LVKHTLCLLGGGEDLLSPINHGFFIITKIQLDGNHTIR